MPTHKPPETSLEAYESLDGNLEAAWQSAIAGALLIKPRSAAWLAHDMGASYHDLERRCSALKRRGVLRFGPKVKNPSGRMAHVLEVTEAGRHWIATGEWPARPVSRRDVEVRVIAEARRVVAAWIASESPPIKGLAEAIRDLDRVDRRPSRDVGGGVLSSERRRWLAERGFYLSRSGVPRHVGGMATPHLVAADRVLVESGFDASCVERGVVLDELHRRRGGALE